MLGVLLDPFQIQSHPTPIAILCYVTDLELLIRWFRFYIRYDLLWLFRLIYGNVVEMARKCNKQDNSSLPCSDAQGRPFSFCYIIHH